MPDLVPTEKLLAFASDVESKILKSPNIGAGTKHMLIGYLEGQKEILLGAAQDELICAVTEACLIAKSERPLEERKEGVRLALSQVLRKKEK